MIIAIIIIITIEIRIEKKVNCGWTIYLRSIDRLIDRVDRVNRCGLNRLHTGGVRGAIRFSLMMIPLAPKNAQLRMIDPTLLYVHIVK